MPLLDALLAFIIIIFAISMAVTVVVQVILDISGRRSKFLEKMLNEYYEYGLVPAVKRIQPSFSLSEEKKKELHTFLAGTAQFSKKDHQSLQAPGANLVEIQEDEFKGRLRSSSTGKDIETTLIDTEKQKTPPPNDESIGKVVNSFFDELSVRFQVFGDRSTESFRRFARFTSIIVGLILAFLFNIDGFYLLKTIVGDPAVRSAVVTPDKELVQSLKAIHKDLLVLKSTDLKSPVEKLKTTYLKLKDENQKAAKLIPEKNLKEITNKIDKLNLEFNGLFLKLKDIDSLSEKKKNKTIEDIKTAVASIDFSQGNKLLFGWDYWPKCNSKIGNEDLRCKKNIKFSLKNSTSLNWIAGIVFTGFLIGLGAPFWYDLIKAVSRARRTVKDPATTLKP